MSYSVRYTKKAIQSLKKLDRSVLILIKAWIEKNLVDTDDPRRHGKGLTSNRSGQWRYRVGNYRILAEIEDRELIILVIEADTGAASMKRDQCFRTVGISASAKDEAQTERRPYQQPR